MSNQADFEAHIDWSNERPDVVTDAEYVDYTPMDNVELAMFQFRNNIPAEPPF